MVEVTYASKTELGTTTALICYAVGGLLIVGSLFSHLFLAFCFTSLLMVAAVSTMTGY